MWTTSSTTNHLISLSAKNLKEKVDPNPVGSYRRTFNLPTDWDKKNVFLHFDGIYSGAYVWVNGQYIGYTEGGNNDAEFDISKAVKTGENQVAVQVIRWQMLLISRSRCVPHEWIAPRCLSRGNSSNFCARSCHHRSTRCFKSLHQWKDGSES